jgi:hypothetical protein
VANVAYTLLAPMTLKSYVGDGSVGLLQFQLERAIRITTTESRGRSNMDVPPWLPLLD